MKKGRKEVTVVKFKGVSADGGFVFEALDLNSEKHTMVKVTSYAEGIVEIAIDCAEAPQRVAEVVAGMFVKQSEFSNLDLIILNYRNIRLEIGKNTGRKNIICMLMKAMAIPRYKDSNNQITVDFQVCQKCYRLRDSDCMEYLNSINSFYFDEKFGKGLWFSNFESNPIIISAIKDGIVTVEAISGDIVTDFVADLKKFFIPYSNLYGIKAVEVEFNDFAITVDEQNVDRILQLYARSNALRIALLKKEVDLKD